MSDEREQEEEKHAEEAQPHSRALQARQEETLTIQMQRITKVEETVLLHDQRISFVEAQQGDMKTLIHQLASLASEHSTSLALNDAATVAIRERTDVLADHMEKMADRLTEKQEKTSERIDKLESERISKLESTVGRQETKWGFLQALGLAFIGVALAFIAQHLADFFNH